MESALVSELSRAWELTRKLELEVPAEFKPLAKVIMASLERAVPSVKLGSSSAVVYATNMESTLSAIGSPHSCGSDAEVSKKRKTMHRWATQVKVCSGAVLEGAIEDGYTWRKYGQKDILGATYPRGYYRCTNRKTQGCMATKQVQRSENPTIFDVMYRGEHTCRQQLRLATLPGVRSKHQSPVESINLMGQPDTAEGGFNPESSLFPSCYSQQFMPANLPQSATVIETGFPDLPQCQFSCLENGIEPELSDIVSSVSASLANSPIADFDFGIGVDYLFDPSLLDSTFFP